MSKPGVDLHRTSAIKKYPYFETSLGLKSVPSALPPNTGLTDLDRHRRLRALQRWVALAAESEQLIAKRGKARTGNLWHPLSFGSATTCSSSVTPLRPTGATMPNSAR